MITFFHLDQGKLIQTRVEESPKTLPANVVWVDLINPAGEEARLIERMLEVEIPSRDEMQEIEASSRLYAEDESLVMTMSVLNKPTSDEPEAVSVTFILIKNKLLTVRYIDPMPFGIFIQRIKRHPYLVPSGEAALLGLLEQIAASLADILEGAAADIEGLSRTIFSSKEEVAAPGTDYKKAIQRIGHVGDLSTKAKGSLLNLTRLLLFFAAQADADKETKARMKTLIQDSNSIDEQARFLSAKVSFLLDATLGLINLEQNNIIKMFSVAAVAFLPPTLIASIYGMNFVFLPELHWHYGYPFALILMILSAVLPFWYFRRKKWL